MEKVILGGAIVYLDFALLTDVDGQLGVISYFNRSNSQVRSFGASLTFEKGIQLDKKFYSIEGQKFQTYIQPVVVGKMSCYRICGYLKFLLKKQICRIRYQIFLRRRKSASAQTGRENSSLRTWMNISKNMVHLL